MSDLPTALYARVSTKTQTTDTQEQDLRAWVERCGETVGIVYLDVVSGDADRRDALARLLVDAHARRFRRLRIWALDRLTREGGAEASRLLSRLRDAGVEVLSLNEPWLATSGPIGELLILIFGWVAAQEKRRISERVRAGIARVRRYNPRWGRISRSVDLDEVSSRRLCGESWTRIAEEMGISKTVILRAMSVRLPLGGSASEIRRQSEPVERSD